MESRMCMLITVDVANRNVIQVDIFMLFAVLLFYSG